MPAKLTSLIDRRAVIALQLESITYTEKKPGHIPPADSPSRPNLARLWLLAPQKKCKRAARTFTHHGVKYGIVYMGNSLCVMDIAWRQILVKPPASMDALCRITGAKEVNTS